MSYKHRVAIQSIGGKSICKTSTWYGCIQRTVIRMVMQFGRIQRTVVKVLIRFLISTVGTFKYTAL